MRRLPLAALLFACAAQAQTPQHRLFEQPNLPRQSLAYFEAFPTSGQGTFGACSTTAPTGAKGESVVFARAGSATCVKGNQTTGIAPGDMVLLSANQLRVENPDGLGLKPRVERSGTNNVIQDRNLCSGWTDTAACTPAAAVSPTGATDASQLNDSSGAALQGASIAITTSSLTQHAFGCYVEAGSATSVTVSITGTGNSAGNCTATATGLAGTTYQRVQCGSASAFGAGLTGVTVAVSVGTVVGDTGTLNVFGCQHETGRATLSSLIPTSGAAASRVADSPPYVDLPSAICSTGNCCVSATVTVGATTAQTWAPFSLFASGTSYFQPYNDGVNYRAEAYTGTVLNFLGATKGSLSSTRVAQWQDGSSLTASVGAATYSVAGTRAVTATRLYMGGDSTTNIIDGWIGGIQADPTATRCTR